MAVGCGDESEESGDEEESSNSTAESQIGTNSRFTDCEETDGTEEYCAAERLKWTYDDAEQVASFDHTRTILNCAGDRKTRAYLRDGDVYEIREIDAPGENGARAGCKCTFNFGIDIPDVSGEIDVEIVQEITDNPEDRRVSTVWSGSIDLNEGSGTVVIDDEEETTWCGQSS